MKKIENQTNSKVLTIEFKGHLPTYKDYDYQHSMHEKEDQFHPEELVDIMQKSEGRIKSQISSELKKRISYSVDIEVEIEFRRGSVEWEGVLYILNWFAVVGGTIGLIDYMSRIAIHVVNKVIKKNLPRGAATQKIETDIVDIIAPPNMPSIEPGEQQEQVPKNQPLTIPPSGSVCNYQPPQPIQVIAEKPEKKNSFGLLISAVSMLTLVNTILLIFIFFVLLSNGKP